LRKKLSFLLLFFLPALAFAQPVADSIAFDVSTIKDKAGIEKKTFFFVDEKGILHPDGASAQTFAPLSGFSGMDEIPSKYLHLPVWLKFTLRNPSDKPDTIHFYPGFAIDKLNAYKADAAGRLSSFYNDASSGFIPIVLQKGEQSTFFVSAVFFKLKFNKVKATVIENNYLRRYKNEIDAPYNERNNGLKLLSGMLLLMVMFTLVNFIITKRAEFFYNFLYSFFMFFLIFYNAYLTRSSGWFRGFFMSWLDLFLLVAATVAYIQFVIIFLRTTIRHRWLNKLLKFEKYGLIAMMALYTYLHFFTKTFDAQEMLENVMKIFMLIIAVIYIVIALKQRNKLVNYLVAGTSVQVACSIISLFIIITGIEQTNLFTSAGFFFGIGVIASVVFYLMGLTYKNRIELIEQIREREAIKSEMDKKEFERQLEVINARQNERNRISADMHDDLGSGMTTIRLFSEIAMSKMGENKIPEIEKISNSANDLLNKMNAIIWSMSSSNDTFANMVAYIRRYAIGYCEDNNLKCNISLPETLPDMVVSGEIRRNVFLVVKEALHNVVKHSGAKEVAMNFFQEGKRIQFTIHDNGKGIDPEKINTFGNGLRNMKKRMEDLGINYKIENKNGTLITLSYEL
jgi:signal transduction histidine kinase